MARGIGFAAVVLCSFLAWVPEGSAFGAARHLLQSGQVVVDASGKVTVVQARTGGSAPSVPSTPGVPVDTSDDPGVHGPRDFFGPFTPGPSNDTVLFGVKNVPIGTPAPAGFQGVLAGSVTFPNLQAVGAVLIGEGALGRPDAHSVGVSWFTPNATDLLSVPPQALNNVTFIKLGCTGPGSFFAIIKDENLAVPPGEPYETHYTCNLIRQVTPTRALGTTASGNTLGELECPITHETLDSIATAPEPIDGFIDLSQIDFASPPCPGLYAPPATPYIPPGVSTSLLG
jgi:hypothetical protein